MLNYLGKLGWSLDDKTEYLELPEMIANFSLERVNESPASFDPDKLFWLAGEYMMKLSVAEKVDGSLPFLRRAGLIGDTIDDSTRAKLTAVATYAAERIKLFTDMTQYAGPILRKDPDYDPKAVVDKLKKPGVADRLQEFHSILAKLEPFDATTVKNSFTTFAESHAIKPKDLDGPLRIAVTGVAVGFGLHETMILLGREESLRRIELGIHQAKI